jgi:Alpha amylase, catalytic domain
MKPAPRYPSLYQINTRVWLRRLAQERGQPVTLADIDTATVDGFARQGFDWIWLLSVWQTGPAGRAVSRGNPAWRAEFKAALPDLVEDDICGSGFAITGYTVSDALGGDQALAAFRARLAQHGIRLMLDFVPNHTAIDHPWAASHPEYYRQGSEALLAAAPQNYLRVETEQGPRILAHGRDPNFPGWPDTLQLDYANRDLQRAKLDELLAVAGQCDGVRCDMAMLLLPDVFQRTWGVTPEPFWPTTTAAVRQAHPGFTFMAEVYWDLEWTLQQQGFDYCYDKRLYDRLQAGNVAAIRDHLNAGLDYQDRLARFLENHDESRAAAAFPWPQHRAAAAITFLSPGLRFFQQGEAEGARVHVPTHLCRGPVEPVDEEISSFYDRLLLVLRETDAFRGGDWTQLHPTSAWPGNGSADGFVACAWAGKQGLSHIVVVNYAPTRSQCYLVLPFPELLRGRRFRLTDRIGDEIYERDGDDLAGGGLYIDQAAWGINVFEVQAVG